jgi:hypothetical protein
MKKTKINSRYFILFLVVTIVFSGCNSLNKMRKNYKLVEAEVPSDALEVHADSVTLEFQLQIPPKYFHKKAIAKVEPTLKYADQSLPLEPVFAKGEKVESADDIDLIIYYKEGGTIAYKSKMPYDPRMKNSKLFVAVSYKIDNKYDELDICTSLENPFMLAEGCITTALSVKSTDDVSLGGNFKPEKTAVEGEIFFQINKAKIHKPEKEGETMIKFRDLVGDPEYDVEGVSLWSSASPDGPLEFNEKLATWRSEATFEYLVDEFKKLGFYAVLDSNFKRTEDVPEDWDGFKTKIQNSDLDVKNDILSITNSTLAPEEKEVNIKKLGDAPWKVMAEDILPKLRRSKVQLWAMYPKVRHLDILEKLYAEKKLDSLNEKELLLLAYNTEDLDNKYEVYKYYDNKYPKTWIGKNNMAYIHLNKGEYDEALEMLEAIHQEFPENPAILNNMGICYKHKKDYKKAMEYFEKAKIAGENTNRNIGIVNLHTANYDEAVKNFQPERCDYNKALAYVLNKNYDEAKKAIDCIEDKSADDFYLRAIIGARTEDLELMSTSLTRAVKLDESVRERAKKDFEFRKYWDKAEFTNAIR